MIARLGLPLEPLAVYCLPSQRSVCPGSGGLAMPTYGRNPVGFGCASVARP